MYVYVYIYIGLYIDIDVYMANEYEMHRCALERSWSDHTLIYVYVYMCAHMYVYR